MTDISRGLAEHTGLREIEVRRIMLTAPRRYKVYSIEKKAGGRRWIAQPAREVKLVQRALVDILLSKLRVHPAAMAYRPNVGLQHNAEIHAGRGPILKMDLKDFFPSIRGEDWRRYCGETGCVESDEEVALTTSLLFHRTRGSALLRLAIGAPSSPALSNALMYEFDTLVSDAIGKTSRGFARYTRYADDLTFSAPRTGYLNGIQRDVASVIRALRFPRLDINGSKTTEVTRKYHRVVTGLTLSNDGKVSLGRDRKRMISAQLHHFALGRLTREEKASLAGTLAFVNAVEPGFLDVLSDKYSREVLVTARRQP